MTAPISAAGGIDRIMALRAQILEQNQALGRAAATPAAAPNAAVPSAAPTSFTDALSQAVQNVNASQARASELSASYERGETIDIAKVMLARQEASVGFEATLQVRNKLLSAYRDIMSMPV